MKAMVLSHAAPVGARPLHLSDVAELHPAVGDVTIEVEACGVCRTDLHIVEGEVSARLPIVPGHQAVGRVVECGPGVETLRPGDRVGVGWLSATCGRCVFCRGGRENVCRLAVFTGRDRD